MTHPNNWPKPPDNGHEPQPDRDHPVPRSHDTGDAWPDAPPNPRLNPGPETRPNAASPDAPPMPGHLAAASAALAAPPPAALPVMDPLNDPAATQPGLPVARPGSTIAPTAHPGQLQIDPLTSGPLNHSAHGVPTAPASPGAFWRSPKPRPGIKLLIVEDQFTNLRLMEHILELAGYACVTASNGRQALEVFERERPDLVLTDIAMPIMDGLEATAALRARPGGARIPIIGVSAFAMPGDRERALYGGCNAYLTKPYRPQDLVDLVGRLLDA